MPARLGAVLRLALRLHELEPDSVAAENPDGEPGLGTQDQFRASRVVQGIVGADKVPRACHILATRVQFEFRPVAKEQTQCEEGLRGDAVMVVAVAGDHRR